MNKFEKGVSVLAVMAMVNPATIVSATTATGQPQSDVTQEKMKTLQRQRRRIIFTIFRICTLNRGLSTWRIAERAR